MNCPCCTAPLRELSYEGVSIRTCDGCGGEFVGPQPLRHIVNVRLERFGPEIHKMVESRMPTEGVPVKDGRTLECPSCKGATGVINYTLDSGVLIDRCTKCGGMWLDAQELENLQALLERWEDEAPARLEALEPRLRAVRETNRRLGAKFEGSRFAFVNAVVNRILRAA